MVMLEHRGGLTRKVSNQRKKNRGVEVRPFILECCGKKIKPDRVISLEPNYRYVDRYLLYGVCQNPKCQRLVFQLREFDLMTGNIVIDRNKPKRIKHQSEWVEKLESQETTNPITTKIKHGNKSAMAFIFGRSKITPLGTLHTGIDFNGTKRKEFLTVN